MFDIAFHSRGGPTQIRVIAERQAIPPRFLEQIFQDLKRAQLVTSKRGPKGGYALARPPEEISVGCVVRAVEGPVQMVSADSDAPAGDATSRRVTERLFVELAEAIESSLDAVTLEDLCERGESEGVLRLPPRRYVYSI